MIILGVDPGTLITGYGVIEQERGTLRLLDIGVVKNPSSRSMPLRLKSIYEILSGIIDRHHPDEFAIETAFYSKNAQSALKIGQARGVAILAAVNREMPVTEYAPREIKQAVAGSGAASKEQVQYMMLTIFRLRKAPRYFDATDALAVAVCHAHRITKPRRAYRDWATYAAAHPERVVSPGRTGKGSDR